MNKNNSSGYTGVSFDKANNKYRAYIDICGDKFRLGYFSSINEAVSRRNLVKNMIEENGVLSYLKFKFPNLSQDVCKCAVVIAASQYFEHSNGRTFFVFLKSDIVPKMIKDMNVVCYDLKWSNQKFDLISNDPILSSFFIYGHSVHNIKSTFKIQQQDLPTLLSSTLA